MYEAEVTVHHLGPSQVRRGVKCYPMETVCPHCVTKMSWVIGGWSLNHKECAEIAENIKQKHLKNVSH